MEDGIRKLFSPIPHMAKHIWVPRILSFPFNVCELLMEPVPCPTLSLPFLPPICNVTDKVFAMDQLFSNLKGEGPLLGRSTSSIIGNAAEEWFGWHKNHQLLGPIHVIRTLQHPKHYMEHPHLRSSVLIWKMNIIFILFATVPPFHSLDGSLWRFMT